MAPRTEAARGILAHVVARRQIDKRSATEAKRGINLVASVATLPSLLVTALLLVARTAAARYALPAPSADAILAATGASKSRAYQLALELAALVLTLARRVGRPAKPAPAPASVDTIAITLAVLAYVMRHPGCVDRGRRQSYAQGFRRFVLDLCAKHPDIAVETMAAAIAVPLGTLKDWLRTPLSTLTVAKDEPPTVERSAEVSTVDDEIDLLRFKSIIEAWRRWCGSFRDFCGHVRRDLHIHYGRDLIAKILRVEGLRPSTARGTVVS